MYRIIILLLLSITFPVLAQSNKLISPQEIPEPPEPVEMPVQQVSEEEELAIEEPQVTIKKRGEDIIEEFDRNGRVYLIKITPRIGFPYYLIDDRGDGTFTRETLNQGISPPMWLIFQY